MHNMNGFTGFVGLSEANVITTSADKAAGTAGARLIVHLNFVDASSAALALAALVAGAGPQSMMAEQAASKGVDKQTVPVTAATAAVRQTSIPETEKRKTAPAAEAPKAAAPPAATRAPRQTKPKAPEPVIEETESAEDVVDAEGETVPDDDFSEPAPTSSVQADAAAYAKKTFREIMEHLIKVRKFTTAKACLDVCTAIHDQVEVLSNIPLDGGNALAERVERAFTALQKMA